MTPERALLERMREKLDRMKDLEGGESTFAKDLRAWLTAEPATLEDPKGGRPEESKSAISSAAEPVIPSIGETDPALLRASPQPLATLEGETPDGRSFT